MRSILPAAVAGQRDQGASRSASGKGGRSRCTQTRGEELICAHIASDEGAARLGERPRWSTASSRVGQTGVVFYDTLFDENAASHIALGAAIVQCVEGAEALSEAEQVAAGINKSSLHTDFMIGGPQVDIWGVSANGEEIPILADGGWVLS